MSITSIVRRLFPISVDHDVENLKTAFLNVSVFVSTTTDIDPEEKKAIRNELFVRERITTVPYVNLWNQFTTSELNVLRELGAIYGAKDAYQKMSFADLHTFIASISDVIDNSRLAHVA